jgi:cytochrome b561
MSKTQISSLPEDTSIFQKLAAKVVPLTIYINLAAIPTNGLLIGIFYWMGLKSGLTIELTINLHEFSISTIYWLIAIHVAAAIFHRFKNDGLWSSMVPFLTEGKRTKE